MEHEELHFYSSYVKKKKEKKICICKITKSDSLKVSLYNKYLLYTMLYNKYLFPSKHCYIWFNKFASVLTLYAVFVGYFTPLFWTKYSNPLDS